MHTLQYGVSFDSSSLILLIVLSKRTTGKICELVPDKY